MQTLPVGPSAPSGERPEHASPDAPAGAAVAFLAVLDPHPHGTDGAVAGRNAMSEPVERLADDMPDQADLPPHAHGGAAVPPGMGAEPPPDTDPGSKARERRPKELLDLPGIPPGPTSNGIRGLSGEATAAAPTSPGTPAQGSFPAPERAPRGLQAGPTAHTAHPEAPAPPLSEPVPIQPADSGPVPPTRSSAGFAAIRPDGSEGAFVMRNAFPSAGVPTAITLPAGPRHAARTEPSNGLRDVPTAAAVAIPAMTGDAPPGTSDPDDPPMATLKAASASPPFPAGADTFQGSGRSAAAAASAFSWDEHRLVPPPPDGPVPIGTGPSAAAPVPTIADATVVTTGQTPMIAVSAERTQGPVPLSSLPAQMDRAIEAMRLSVRTETAPAASLRTEIELAPAELGRLRISLETTERGLALSVTADRPEALEVVRRHLDALARNLSAENVPLHRIELTGDAGGQPRGGDGRGDPGDGRAGGRQSREAGGHVAPGGDPDAPSDPGKRRPDRPAALRGGLDIRL